MAKNTVGEWSTTANDNTDVGGINIAEGCAASNINNAIREVMKQVKILNGDAVSVKPPTRTFLTSGVAATYTPPTGCRAIHVTVQGAGGDGGDTSLTSGTTCSYAGGGGAGGRAIRLIQNPAPGTYTIGGVGTNTTYADGTYSMVGGAANNANDSGSDPQGGGYVGSGSPGGTASGGTINLDGNPGGAGMNTGSTSRGVLGFGGNSPYGAGGRSLGQLTTNSFVAGTDGKGYGSGGGGAGAANSQASRPGGSGMPGCIEIWEFY